MSYNSKYTGAEVEALLGKADTALQEHQDISGKQDKLVSGTNIKTVNGKSILGSGDLVIESGSDDIYYFDIVDIDASSGIVTAEEFEKIKKCSVLIFRVVVDGYTYPISIVYTQKIDAGLLVGLEGIVFSGIVSDNTNNSMGNLLTFTPNEDGSASYETTNMDLYTFKTINGESILGEGDIVIEGGSGGSSGGGVYAEVNHGTSDTTFTLTPNTFHVWDEVSALTLNLGSETNGVANEYLFQFNSGSTATTLTLPDTLKWANDSAPTIEANKIYQISILKGLASVLMFTI